MVGDQPVYKTPSANVAVAMANLDRLLDTPECQGVRTSVRAHLIAAMGQTATLLKRVQAVSYTEATSDQTNRSRTSPPPTGITVGVPPTIIERIHDVTMVVGMLTVTASRTAGAVKK